MSASGLPIITCPPSVTVTACNSVVTFTTPSATDPCAGGCASNPLATVLSEFNTDGAAITAAIPSPYNFALDNGVTATSIWDGGNDMYDTGNMLNTDLGTSIPYTGGAINTHAAFGGGQYFTQHINNMFVMVADLNGVSSFSTTGNNGADGSGTANGFTYNVTVGCMTYDVFVKRVNGASDPSINQIFIVPSGSGATHSFSTDTNDGLHTLSNLNTATRLYYLLVGGSGGYAYSNAEIQAIVQNFLTQVNAAGSPAPTVTQIAGLPSGSTFPVGTNVVTFEAVGGSGTSTCSFNVVVDPVSGPLMTCPSDITLGACSPVATFATPTATDPCVPACADASLATVLAGFNSNGAAITGAIPSPFNFSLDGGLGASDNYISDGGSDMYDSGNYLNTNLGASIYYTNGVVTANPAFGAGGQYFTQKINNMFVMVADLNNVSSFFTTGGNGADGSGNADGFTYSVTVGCRTFDVFVKRINGAGDPSINQIFIVPSGSGASHTFSTNTNDGLHTLSNLNTATRLYYLLVGGSGGYAYSNAEIQTIVQNFLTQAGAVASNPVTVTQTAGLPSGSSFPVGSSTVTFEATGPTGTSTCSFTVTVNSLSAAIAPSVTNVCSGGSATLTASGGGSYLWSTGESTAAITVSPATTTAYTVTVTDAYTCTASASQTITVNTASTSPTIAPIAGSYCPNTDVTLTAAGGTAGTGSDIYWYTGANGSGTALGSGSSITLTTTTTTTIYARREGTCNTTSDDNETVTVKSYVYAANATSTNTYCTDNAGWHHFYVGNDIIFSIQGDLSAIPVNFPMVTIWDNGTYYQNHVGPYSTAGCPLGWTPGEEQFEMARSWNVDLGGGAPIGAYNIRFYHRPAERSDVEAAAAAWMAAYPICGYTYKYATPNGFYWFKNTGSTYSAPDYDGTHYGGSTASTANAITYVEQAGIPSFSGGSGAVILVPSTLLAVEWLYFKGDTDGKVNHLHWGTKTEEHTAFFEVQRSHDGVEYQTIATVAAAGNSSAAQHYNYDDINPLPGLNYYRIRLVDTQNNGKLTDVVVLEIKAEDNYVFYPNPTQDVVYYQFNSTSKGDLQIEVIDVLGRSLQTVNAKTNVGVNRIAVNLVDYPNGAYTLRATHLGTDATHVSKIIKNRP